tara:strand:+ start:787 stop:1002 length:216 start_codon:yes stop_codon:yes gene_type:complete
MPMGFAVMLPTTQKANHKISLLDARVINAVTPEMQPMDGGCIWVGFHQIVKVVHEPEYGAFPTQVIDQRFH